MGYSYGISNLRLPTSPCRCQQKRSPSFTLETYSDKTPIALRWDRRTGPDHVESGYCRYWILAFWYLSISPASTCGATWQQRARQTAA